jgi:hypothetical protein
VYGRNNVDTGPNMKMEKSNQMNESHMETQLPHINFRWEIFARSPTNTNSPLYFMCANAKQPSIPTHQYQENGFSANIQAYKNRT